MACKTMGMGFLNLFIKLTFFLCHPRESGDPETIYIVELKD